MSRKSIVMECPGCKEIVRFSSSMVGKWAPCEHCSEKIRVPRSSRGGNSGSGATKFCALSVLIAIAVAGYRHYRVFDVIQKLTDTQPQQIPMTGWSTEHPNGIAPSVQPLQPQAPLASQIPSPNDFINQRRDSATPPAPPQSQQPPNMSHSANGVPQPNLPGNTVAPSNPQPATNQRKPARPLNDANSNAEKSILVGGTGGGPFVRGLDGEAMVGVNWQVGEWAGTRAVGTIFPITSDGRSAPGFQQVKAPAGYAVGGMNVYAPLYVSSIQLVYMKLLDDGTLDPEDTKLSPWIGAKPPKGKDTKISGEGRRIVGIHGRGAAVVDAIGLLIER